MDAATYQSLPTLILINSIVFVVLFVGYIGYKKFFASKRAQSIAVQEPEDFWASFSQKFFSQNGSAIAGANVQNLLTLTLEKMNLSCALITQLDFAKNTFIVKESFGAKNPWSKGDGISKHNSYCGNIFQTKRPVIIDYTAVSEWRNHDVYKNYHIEAFVGFPLYIGGEFFGVVSFFDFSARQNHFSSEDLLFVGAVAKWTELLLEQNLSATIISDNKKAA